MPTIDHIVLVSILLLSFILPTIQIAGISDIPDPINAQTANILKNAKISKSSIKQSTSVIAIAHPKQANDESL